MSIQRKDFLKNTGILTLGAAFLPALASASQVAVASQFTLARFLGRRAQLDAGVIDLHFHAMKVYLWDRHMERIHVPLPGDNMVQMQTDIHRIQRGHMKGFLCTHYLPEARMSTDMATLVKLYPLLEFFDPKFKARQGTETAGNFVQLKGMISQMETEIAKLANKYGKKIRIAHNFKDFQQAIEHNYIAVAHAIEGGHALGQDLCSQQDYINNLNTLKGLGVAQITLSHFFPNALSFPVEGMAPNEKTLTGFAWKYNPDPKALNPDNKPLTPIGEAVVKEMFDIGIVVDLTHSTSEVRRRVFELNNARPDELDKGGKRKKIRPVIFSHVGLQDNFIDPNPADAGFKYYSVSKDEVINVIKTDGVIGVIFENYWLVGRNTHLGGKDYHGCDYRNGIKYVVKTIKDIAKITEDYYLANPKEGSTPYDHIAIGSDFDGLADAPADLVTPATLPHLANEMLRRHIPRYAIPKITNANVMRVLEKGWGNQ